jgi:hypothetical protein
MKKIVEFEICDGDNEITVPFDNPPAGKYTLTLSPETAENGDGIILELDRKACISFAELFGQLACGKYDGHYHLHLGYSSENPIGPPGLRIVLNDDLVIS